MCKHHFPELKLDACRGKLVLIFGKGVPVMDSSSLQDKGGNDDRSGYNLTLEKAEMQVT